jgi:hypothetical protein
VFSEDKHRAAAMRQPAKGQASANANVARRENLYLTSQLHSRSEPEIGCCRRGH